MLLENLKLCQKMTINILRKKLGLRNQSGIKVSEMSLSISYNKVNNGIDAASLKEVTKQIFQRANSQTFSVLENADLSKFNRVSQGTDLYKVKASKSSQIAITNSGMQVNLSENALSSLKYLSNQASKSVLKNVDGKINVPEDKETVKKQNVINLANFGRLTETVDLGSDKKGSNPFYKGEVLKVNKEEEKDEKLNIFA